MKKITILTAVLLFMTIGIGFAGENLNNWEVYIESGTVSFTPNNESAEFSLKYNAGTTAGNYTWGNLNSDFPNAYGLLATFKVKSYTGNNAYIGLRKYVGWTENGNLILAQIFLEYDNGQLQLQYAVRERTTDYKTVKYLARGVLGNWDGMWQIGDEITIGLAYIGQDIYFYTPGVEAFTKVQMINVISPLTDQFTYVQIAGYTDGSSGADGTISGTVSNVTILQ